MLKFSESPFVYLDKRTIVPINQLSVCVETVTGLSWLRHVCTDVCLRLIQFLSRPISPPLTDGVLQTTLNHNEVSSPPPDSLHNVKHIQTPIGLPSVAVPRGDAGGGHVM